MASRVSFAAVAFTTILLLHISIQPAPAQVLYGSIVGTVTDSSGAAVPEASITLVNVATSQTREVTSSNQGTYSVTNLPAGTYNLTINKSGFKSYAVPPTASWCVRVLL